MGENIMENDRKLESSYKDKKKIAQNSVHMAQCKIFWIKIDKMGIQNLFNQTRFLGETSDILITTPKDLKILIIEEIWYFSL
jgi:hypothetical protein